MSREQRRAIIAICIIIGITYLASATLALTLTPMAQDLGLSDVEAETTLALPAVGSLVIIFLAGRMGDQWGHRRVIIASSAVYVFGAIVMASSSAMTGIAVGALLAGAAATAMQIVAVGLLQRTAPTGHAHIVAFTSFGMVFPAVYLFVPPLTGFIVLDFPWQTIPITWAIAGLLIPLLAWRMLQHPGKASRLGEPWTPLLAGLSLAALVMWINRIHMDGWNSIEAALPITVGVLSLVACALLMRGRRTTSLTAAPLRNAVTLVLLVGVALLALTDTLTFITVGLQYLYDLTTLDVALLLIPAEAGAVLGAKSIAAWLMHRYGPRHAGLIAMPIFALSLLTLTAVTSTSPLWVPVLATVLLATFGSAAITILNTDVMSRAVQGGDGMLSAYRGAASALGGALSILILGSGIMTAASITDGPSAVTPEAADALTAGFRSDGVTGAAVVTFGWALLAWVQWRGTKRATST